MSVILTNRNLRDAGVAPRRGGLESSSTGAAPVPDDALSRILKLIPGEASAGYTTAIAIGTEATDKSARFLPPTAFLLCAALVVLLIRRDAAAHKPPVKPEPLQIAFQLVAFTAWAFAIHNPLAAWCTVPPWIPALGVIFLPIFGALLLGDPAVTPSDPPPQPPPPSPPPSQPPPAGGGKSGGLE